MWPETSNEVLPGVLRHSEVVIGLEEETCVLDKLHLSML